MCTACYHWKILHRLLPLVCVCGKDLAKFSSSVVINGGKSGEKMSWWWLLWLCTPLACTRDGWFMTWATFDWLFKSHHLENTVSRNQLAYFVFSTNKFMTPLSLVSKCMILLLFLIIIYFLKTSHITSIIIVYWYSQYFSFLFFPCSCYYIYLSINFPQ